MDNKPVDREVFEILGRAKPIKTDRGPIVRAALVVIAVLIAAGTAWAAYIFINGPKGAFINPANGFFTGRLVEIEGYTQNIPPDRRFIWVTVDVPGIGLCWPKRPIYRLNGPFKTKFLEQGPNREFIVGLYAVDHSYNTEILKWFEECRITKSAAGFPLLPPDYRLDAIVLKLKGT